jgi:hypothetical protein
MFNSSGCIRVMLQLPDGAAENELHPAKTPAFV